MGAKGYGVLASSCLTVFALDQITKAYITACFPLYASRTVIPGFFNVVHYRNTGVAFGLFGGTASPLRDAVLLLFPLAAITGILLFAFMGRPKRRDVLLALGGIMGGALGNLLDRFRYGGVVDFLDVYLGTVHWPAFNLADSAISIGAFYLILRYGRMKEP
jgi:signal peptidase II